MSREEKNQRGFIGMLERANFSLAIYYIQPFECITNAQVSTGLDRKYWLRNEEVTVAGEILGKFKEDIYRQYATRELSLGLKGDFFSHEQEFFLYVLYTYLLRYMIYNITFSTAQYERLQEEAVKSNDMTAYKKYCSELRLVLAKLCLTSAVYCKNNKFINPKNDFYQIDMLKDEIESLIQVM